MAIKQEIRFTGRDDTRAAIGSLQRGLLGLERRAASLTRGLFAVGGTAGLGLAIRKSLEFADAIGKTADKVGVGVEALQELRYAAQQNGVEQRALDIGLQRFSRRLGEAAQGQGELRATLEQYGIAVRDVNGRIRSTEDVLKDYADAVQGAESKQEQLRLAFKGFDSEGAALVNLLRQGSGAFDEYGAAARRLGIVMDESLIRNAAVANDRLSDLQKVLAIKFATAVTQNADSIITLTNALIDFANFLTEKGAIVASGYRAIFGIANDQDIANELRIQGNTLFRARMEAQDQLNKRLQELDNRWFKNSDPEDDPQVRFWRQRIEALRDQERGIQEQVKALTQAPPPLAAPGAPPGRLDDVPVGGMSDAAAKELERRRREQLRNNINARIKERQREEAELASIYEGTRTALERYNAQMERLEQLRGKLGEDTYMRAAEQAKAEYEAATETLDALSVYSEQAARNIQDSLANFLFDPFQDGLKGMLRSFVDTLRRMAAEAAAAQILESLFPAAAGGLGGFLGGIFGRKAAGGPMAGGRPYLVGERGPEVVVPSGAASVIPNHRLGGNVVVNIDARQNDNPGAILSLVPIIQSNIEQSLSLKMRRGYL